jgi:hypothetical protein
LSSPLGYVEFRRTPGAPGRRETFGSLGDGKAPDTVFCDEGLSVCDRRVEWEVMNTFRYLDDGRPASEWVQADYRLFDQLGVTTTE